MDAARRQFGKVAGVIAAALLGVPWRAQAQGPFTAIAGTRRRPDSASHRESRSLIKPRVLRPGALVGLIAPGGIVDDAIIEKCVNNLESLGFKVKPGRNIRAAHGGYAGTVKERLDDLHAMFADREVKAIWTARGGSGCTALLPHLDYTMIRAHAKILIGYSDITALHLALFRHAGLVTFHGPVAWSSFSDYSVSQMLAVLMSPRSETEIHMSVENSRKALTSVEYALRTLRPGIAEGRLIGGSLSVVSALAGTPYAADIANRLLFLEDVGEAPYRIDRMLTQLQQSAGGQGQPDGLRRAAGIVLGVFTRTRTSESDKTPTLSLSEVLDGQLGTLGIPSAYGYSFGHISHQFTLPVGVRARLDTAQQTLTLLEPAVMSR